MTVRRSSLSLACLIAVSATFAGCEGEGLSFNWFGEPDPPVRGTTDNLASFSPAQNSAAIDGTIGSLCYVQGMRLMQLRGYGLVVGLPGTGSRGCPASIREYLVGELRKARQAGSSPRRHGLTAEQMLDSMDTAVVEVETSIPAGAVKGQVVDVSVRAIDPDVVSLAGGYLLSCELKIFAEVSPVEIIEGRTHARAQGPVFINPFAGGAGSATVVDLREGLVIGGGVNLLDRRLGLVTLMDSYAAVRDIRDTINQRFHGHDRKVAEAESPTNLTLTIPQEYHGREQRFVELVLHLPRTSSRVIAEARTRTLIGELSQPGAPLEDVALALEGVGRSVRPMLRELYADSHRPQATYYAARTGLRLGDELAVEVVARYAGDARSPYRLQAIRELGDSGMAARAGRALQALLADEDPLIRIAAYEALRRVDPSRVRSYLIGPETRNFVLDIVPSSGPSLIYARRTRARRIALIGGERIRVQPPVLYSEDNRPVLLTAQPSDDRMTLIRRDHNGNNVVGPVRVSPLVAELVRFLGDDMRQRDGEWHGVGLDYSSVLHVLYSLYEQRAVNAEMRWEEPSVEELIGPLTPMGRPESDM